jgi:tetratricopeptide (TPR) repeat protein
VWQQFVERHPHANFKLLSVAVDAEPQRVRPFAADLPFPTAVDASGVLGRTFDFDVVPNGLFVDEDGILRFRHIGGFDIRRPEIEQQVEALLTTDFPSDAPPAHVRQEPLDIEAVRVELVERPDDAGLHYALGDALLRETRPAEAEAEFRRAAELDPSDWAAPFALGTVLLQRGALDEAVSCWRTALANDPHNFTIRKQIWLAKHPEKFYPDIDLQWQREQLRREGYTRPT